MTLRRIFPISSVTVLITAISACSGNYSFNTNLDRENFEEYFKAGNVQIITEDDLPHLNYRELGLVEGEACQAKPHHDEPSEADARTDARRKAAEMGANAVMFETCLLTKPENDTCVSVRLCYGRAMVIGEKSDG